MFINNYNFIQEKLDNQKIIILDGANGSELEKRGAIMDQIGWCAPASLTHPNILTDIHSDYIKAGADIITTNTFCSARHVLEFSQKYKNLSVEINEKAVECALESRKKFPNKNICIAGSLSLSYVADIVKNKKHNLAFRREIYGEYDYETLLTNFKEQISIFEKYEIDLIILEMIVDPKICKPAIDAALLSKMPVWLGLSCGDLDVDKNLFAFESQEIKFNETLKMINNEFKAVLLMHSQVKNISKGLEEIKNCWNGPLGTYPHIGSFERPHWKHDNDYTPEKYLNAMRSWIDQGATIIGSCCGMGPEYTSILRKNFI
tara:strand:- start:1197 stop:2150 length:954 start_codon:yes stop_codon:yes gene_type:complete